MIRKNPAAIALGRKGGRANTPAQLEQRRAAAKNAGRPREKIPCVHCGRKTTARDKSRRPACGCERRRG